jgi:ankyrin repeat protein
MPVPQIPLEILLMIARLLTDDEGKLRFADFNAFLKVNRALYACLNRTLWQEAVEFQDITERVFTHLIRTNDLARLEFFLELGADIETDLPKFRELDQDDCWRTGMTPLKIAVCLDNVPMARLLLEHGASLVQRDKFGKPSHSAIHAARSAEMVQLLVDHHADLEQPVVWRPLELYAKRGYIEAMRAALRNGAQIASGGRSALLEAARHNIDAVKLLLEYGADVKKAHGGQTPLHMAAEVAKTDVVKLLLERWPEAIREKDDYGYTPLHMAAECTKGPTFEVVKLLLERWPEGIREKNHDGTTPLHMAAKAAKTDVVRLLLELWPEAIREKDDYGNTPLHRAAECTKGPTFEVVKLLLERWPEGIREKNHDGTTPLHMAAKAAKTDVVRLLLELWPEAIREKDDYGNTPLHLAARCTNGPTFEVVKLLLERWPEATREKDVVGDTPLHVAARGQEIDVVRLLVESWPKGKRVRNEYGQKPLGVFQSWDFQQPEIKWWREIVALLL